MLTLKRLKVLHYRNVAPGSELRFSAGINLILGQNASGKTTLLALISAVCRSSFEGIKDEDFELEYEIASERFSVVAQVSHRRVAMSEEDAILGAGATWEDRYEVKIVDLEGGEALHLVSDDPASAHSRADLIMDWSFIAALLIDRGPRWSELVRSLLDAHSQAYRFDESLDCFAAMTGRSNALRGPAVPPAASVEWVERIGREHPVKHSTAIGAYTPYAMTFDRGHSRFPAAPGIPNVSLVAKICEHLGVPGLEVTPNIREQRNKPSMRSWQAEGFTFEVTRSDGTTIHHDRLSYGQKRLIAFLYYLACNPRVVIADELVNGLHHRWINACMTELGDRQAFLTSQNPLLFDYASFDTVAQVQASFVVCGLEVIDEREQMTWRNMSAESAQIFFDAYQAGIEHVGDILITRGLW